MKYSIICLFVFLCISLKTEAQENNDFYLQIKETQSFLDSAELANAALQLKQAEQYGYAALSKARSLKIDSLEGRALLVLSRAKFNARDFAQTDSLARIALLKLENNTDKFRANLLIVHSLVDGNEYGKTLKAFKETERYLSDDIPSHYLFDYYLDFAAYYYETDDYFKHLEKLFIARKYLTENSSKEQKSTMNYYLSVAYRMLGDYGFSSEILWQDLSDRGEEKHPDLQFIYFGLMANYYEQENYDSLKHVAKLSFSLAEDYGVSSFIGYTYRMVGDACLKESQLDSAEYYYKKGVEISKQRGELKELADNYFGLMKLASLKDDYRQAFEYADLYKETGYNGNDEVDFLLADLYAKQQEFSKAYKLLSANWNLEEKEQPYEFRNDFFLRIFKEKEENERAIAQQKIAQAEQKRKSQFLIFSLISLVGLTIGIAGIFLYRQMKKRNELLRRDLANKKLIEMQAAELKKTEALKSRLFANFSHELRTPITLIRNPIKQLLSKHQFDEEITSTLQDVLLSSEELLTLSNQILELNRADGNEPELHINDFKLSDLFAYLQSKFSGLAQSKGILIKMPDSDVLDISLSTDAKKTEVILSNLLSNALKYSESESEISLSVIDKDESVEIRVEDGGRGITEKDLVQIFDRYYQAKHDSIIPEGGVGIGLAVSREYSQLMGGSIRAESQQGTGSTFILTLPKQLKESKTGTSSKFVFQTADLPDLITPVSPKANNYILIVEDNLKLARYLSEILERDYDVRTVYNGKEALDSLERELPSLIITDLMMPIMGGMEFIERIKQNEEWSEIPVVVLTAKNGVLDELKALRLGVDDYILKPFEPRELEATIYNLTHFAEGRQTARAEQTDFSGSRIKTSIEAKEINKRDRDWLRKAEEQIDELASDPNLNLDMLARNLSVSRTLLNTRMKELTGLTPKRYVNEVRLLKSRRLLESKEYYSVKSVAYSVGFNSEKLFSRNFKSRFGMYPSEYMKKV